MPAKAPLYSQQRPRTSVSFDAAPQRPDTSDALRRQTDESSRYLGTLLLSADRLADGRPSTGLSLSHGLSAGSRAPSRGQQVTFDNRPPRLNGTVIPTTHAAAADERKRLEQWSRHEAELLVVHDAPDTRASPFVYSVEAG